jgi:UDP-GlcNAc3NAcA epimerase
MPERLNSIFEAFHQISRKEEIDILLPLHPRTSKNLKVNLKDDLYNAVKNNSHLKIVPPVSFLDVLVLEKNCKMVMTDSGGLQKEAYFFQKPVIILRTETEWVEIVGNGTGLIADANTENIIQAYNFFDKKKNLTYPAIYGDGRAAEFICNIIINR